MKKQGGVFLIIFITNFFIYNCISTNNYVRENNKQNTDDNIELYSLQNQEIQKKEVEIEANNNEKNNILPIPIIENIEIPELNTIDYKQININFDLNDKIIYQDPSIDIEYPELEYSINDFILNKDLDIFVIEKNIENKKTNDKGDKIDSLNKNTEKNIKTNKIKNTQLILKEIEDKNFDLTNISNIKIEEDITEEVNIYENEPIYISLKGSSWIIKNIEPNILKLNKRENSEKNSLFIFEPTQQGIINLLFIKYDEEQDKIINKTIILKIKGKEIITKKDNTNTTKKKKDDKKEENYIKNNANELYKNQNYKEALQLYENLIKNNQGDSEIYYKMGMIEKINKNYEKSIAYFNKNLSEKDNPFYSKALLELISLYKEQKKYNEAIDNYFKYAGKAEFSETDIENNILMLGDLYLNIKNYKQAIAEYKKFINNYPNSLNIDKAIFYLAYTIENMDINPDYKEAYRLYNIIVNKYPESLYYNYAKKRLLYLQLHYIKVN